MRRELSMVGVGLLVAGLTASAFAQVENQGTGANAMALPVISVKAAQDNTQAGGTVSLDVFVSHAQDLAVYQLQLAARPEGDARGELTVDSITVKKDRPDFVFVEVGQQVLDAADMVQHRVGALRFSGGSSFDKPRYLATFTFRASSDAQGTFKINLKTGDENFLNDSAAVIITHRTDNDATVTVGKVAPTRTETRTRK